MLPYTLFTGISAAALIKLFTPQMQCLLKDGVYLEVGRDEIISPSDLWSKDFCLYLFTYSRSRARKMSRLVIQDSRFSWWARNFWSLLDQGHLGENPLIFYQILSSQLILKGNLWRSVWRICKWISGLKGLTKRSKSGPRQKMKAACPKEKLEFKFFFEPY